MSMFKLVHSDQWRRIGRDKTIQTENRPHIIPLTEVAEEFVKYDMYLAGTGIPVGEVYVDGEWVWGYRFQTISPEVAPDVIQDLEVEAALSWNQRREKTEVLVS